MHTENFLKTSILKNYLRTATSDKSFTLVIYLFLAVSLQLYRKTMIFYGEENVNPVLYFLKRHVKIIKIYMVKFNVSILIRLEIMGFL